MSKTTLTAKEVETLVKLNTKCKEAKKDLDDAKAKLLPNSIAEGKYIAKIGCVQKVGIVQTVIDYKRLIEDHPEINLKKYTTYKDAPRILITDFRDADESFIAKLLH
ncbi:MAG: hypothetical protein J6Z11_04490 [Candidatus Riflebacteria bacterium]|nr:hypothetical protein [Candidatus Riflebacteria bacterium]